MSIYPEHPQPDVSPGIAPQLVRGSAEGWANTSRILKKNEFGLDEDNNILKVGDGITEWADLTAIAGGGGSGNQFEVLVPPTKTTLIGEANVGEDSWWGTAFIDYQLWTAPATGTIDLSGVAFQITGGDWQSGQDNLDIYIFERDQREATASSWDNTTQPFSGGLPITIADIYIGNPSSPTDNSGVWTNAWVDDNDHSQGRTTTNISLDSFPVTEGQVYTFAVTSWGPSNPNIGVTLDWSELWGRFTNFPAPTGGIFNGKRGLVSAENGSVNIESPKMSDLIDVTTIRFDSGSLIWSDATQSWGLVNLNNFYTSSSYVNSQIAAITNPREQLYYVDPGMPDNTGDGSLPGRAFQSLEDARTAAYNSGAQYTVQLLPGTHVVENPDSFGNGWTLDMAGSRLLGAGDTKTNILLSGAYTWGVLGQQANIEVSNMRIVPYPTHASTFTYALVGATTRAKINDSAENQRFERLIVSSSTAGADPAPASLYGVGLDITSGHTSDIAGTVFRQCWAQGGDTNGVTSIGFNFGNGTGGNILRTKLEGCQTVTCDIGVQGNSASYSWTSGGGSGNMKDFVILGGCGDVINIEDFRGENGGKFLYSNGANGPEGGVQLIGNFIGNYTKDGNTIIDYSSFAAINFIGGVYGAIEATADSSIIAVGNSTTTHTFTAMGTLFNNAAGLPGAHSWLKRTIIGCSTWSGTPGIPVAISNIMD